MGYTGHGVDINVYNCDYDDLYNFTDIYYEWAINRIWIKSEVVKHIQEYINDCFFGLIKFNMCRDLLLMTNYFQKK